MKIMKFRYKDGGEFMGIKGDMAVEDVGERGENGMILVVVRDDRVPVFHYGQSFWAYPEELRAGAFQCPMEVDRV